MLWATALDESPKTYGLLLLPLVTLIRGWKKIIAEDTMHFRNSAWRSRSWDLSGRPFLRTSLYGTRRPQASSQRKEAMTVLPNFNTCELHQQPAGHSLQVQQWQTHLGGNQHLSNGSTTYSTIDTMPSTGNLTNCSLSVKSWLLKENLKPRIYQASIISNNNS